MLKTYKKDDFQQRIIKETSCFTFFFSLELFTETFWPKNDGYGMAQYTLQVLSECAKTI